MRVTVIKPSKEKRVYTQDMWIRNHQKPQIKAEELFYAFGIFFIGVLVMVLMYFNHEKTAEKQRIETMKQAIEQTKRY